MVLSLIKMVLYYLILCNFFLVSSVKDSSVWLVHNYSSFLWLYNVPFCEYAIICLSCQMSINVCFLLLGIFLKHFMVIFVTVSQWHVMIYWTTMLYNVHMFISIYLLPSSNIQDLIFSLNSLLKLIVPHYNMFTGVYILVLQVDKHLILFTCSSPWPTSVPCLWKMINEYKIEVNKCIWFELQDFLLCSVNNMEGWWGYQSFAQIWLIQSDCSPTISSSISRTKKMVVLFEKERR